LYESPEFFEPTRFGMVALETRLQLGEKILSRVRAAEWRHERGKIEDNSALERIFDETYKPSSVIL